MSETVAGVLLALLPLPLTLPVALIDLRRRIIPDGLNLALLAAGLLVSGLREPDPVALATRLGEAALAYGLLWAVRAVHARLRGRVGLGLGDVKFLAAATAWTGLAQLPVVILVGSLAALAALALGAVAGQRIDAATRLPFGPFLALGLHTALVLTPAA